MKLNESRSTKFNIFDVLLFIEKKLVLPVFGVFFIIVGIIGLFIPIIQGIAFILLGLALLGNKSVKKFFYEKVLKNRLNNSDSSINKSKSN